MCGGRVCVCEGWYVWRGGVCGGVVWRGGMCGGVVCVEGWYVWRGGVCEGIVWRGGMCGGVVCVEGWCGGVVCVVFLMYVSRRDGLTCSCSSLEISSSCSSESPV